MKKNSLPFIIFAFLLFVMPSLSFAYDENAPDDQYLFQNEEDVARGFIWDLSPQIIKENEKATFIGESEEGTIFFIDNIYGEKSTIAYNFDSEKLSRIVIFSEKVYRDFEQRITDLLTLQSILSTRYGPPTQENFIWRDPGAPYKPKDWGMAVYSGDLRISIFWQQPNQDIILSLSNSIPFEPELKITFQKTNQNMLSNDNDLAPSFSDSLF